MLRWTDDNDMDNIIFAFVSIDSAILLWLLYRLIFVITFYKASNFCQLNEVIIIPRANII